MCLYIDKGENLHCSTQPITCYKIFNRTSDGILHSIFQDYSWGKHDDVIGKTFENKEEVDFSVPEKIRGGFFHAYKSKKDARKQMLSLQSYYFPNSRLALYKCLIPQGTFYIEGVENTDGPESYATQALTLLKKC